MSGKPTAPTSPRDMREITRAMLVAGALIIAIMSLILYAITREAALLQPGGISSMGLAIIIPYYFNKEKQS